MLRRLTPAASQADLSWQPWKHSRASVSHLAELLLASGHPADADSVVSELDSHRAIVYLVYLPAVLELKARAAEALGGLAWPLPIAAASRRFAESCRRRRPGTLNHQPGKVPMTHVGGKVSAKDGGDIEELRSDIEKLKKYLREQHVWETKIVQSSIDQLVAKGLVSHGPTVTDPPEPPRP